MEEKEKTNYSQDEEIRRLKKEVTHLKLVSAGLRGQMTVLRNAKSDCDRKITFLETERKYFVREIQRLEGVDERLRTVEEKYKELLDAPWYRRIFAR